MVRGRLGLVLVIRARRRVGTGRGRRDNLMFIVDEAKACEDGIFHAMERCQPSRILIMSSPGAAAGYFYEAFTKHRERVGYIYGYGL